MVQILIYIIAALQVGDIVTTYMCITSGKGAEANPVLRRLFDAIGLVPGMVLVKGAFIAGLLVYGPGFPVELLGLCAAAYAWVVVSNARVLFSGGADA
ncbi:MAG: hypothetical protein A3I66_00605 [Burkholderiales bacterium RIFCSPLOWO2_02_FULL_57_36]|nr:MAG: hypothetical protein A3I66_00605 [Burkholderiales bacterium RIFCSPLOWO2_02_FULL_57_36]